MSAEILLIGTIPMPIGGVTIYASRLTQRLEQSGLDFSFFDYRRDSAMLLAQFMWTSKLVHINASQPLFILMLVVLAKAMGKKVVLTYHGNIGRYGKIRNLFDRISLRMVDRPLVLNEESFLLAKSWNANTCLTTSFIGPSVNTPLQEDIARQLHVARESYDKIYATTAHNLAYDKNGQEIYGITRLCRIFGRLESAALVVADPSGTYRKELSEDADNVIWISEPHNFYGVLELSDCLIRATSTDGDSISVREALHIGISVLASDCVSRPLGCTVYRSWEELEEILMGVMPMAADASQSSSLDGYQQVQDTYSELSS